MILATIFAPLHPSFRFASTPSDTLRRRAQAAPVSTLPAAIFHRYTLSSSGRTNQRVAHNPCLPTSNERPRPDRPSTGRSFFARYALLPSTGRVAATWPENSPSDQRTAQGAPSRIPTGRFAQRASSFTTYSTSSAQSRAMRNCHRTLFLALPKKYHPCDVSIIAGAEALTVSLSRIDGQLSEQHDGRDAEAAENLDGGRGRIPTFGRSHLR